VSRIQLAIQRLRVAAAATACAIALAAGGGVGHLVAQQPVMPTGKSPVVATVDLTEIGLNGTAAVSHVTVPEGYRMATHTHSARSSIVIVVKGTIREHRGEAVKEYKAGDVFTVAADTTHYNENGGTGPAEYMEVNITNTQAASSVPAGVSR
jgi:quercetin dioxygenase-like cupin family protein